VLNQTPADKLAAALEPICDVDGLLWFLALDVALINNDGYWVRQSDYSFFMDEKGKFHFYPADINEAFRPAQGPGMGGGPGGRGGRGGPGGGGPGGPPDFGPGGPGGFGGGFVLQMPRLGDILPAPVQDQLQLSEEQRKKLAELQKETDAKLEKLLTAEQLRQFKEMKDRGPMVFGGGFGGPMMGGGGGGGVTLDPFVNSTDARKPLRTKLFAVPKYREQYLNDVRTIAEKALDWKSLGPVLAQYRKLIGKELEIDTRKLDSFEAFRTTTADDATAPRGRDFPIRAFADQRRKFLLDYKEVKK
jgi:spore coat protein CotH